MADIFPKRISELQYSLLSPDTMRKLSVAKIIVPELYDEDGTPIRGGLMDLRLGVVDPSYVCETCGKTVNKCPGHFGHIELARPVIHPEFISTVKELVNVVCQNCGRVKLTKQEYDFAIKKVERYRNNRNWNLMYKFIIKFVYYRSKRRSKCPYCSFENKKIEFRKPYNFYIKEENLERKVYPTEIRAIFEKIKDEDLYILGFHPSFSRPEWMILTVLLVPPVTIRPSIVLETGERSEDDLTHKLVDIVRTNQRLKETITTGAPQVIVDDLYSLLQYHIITYFNNTMPGIPVSEYRSGKPLKSLVERIVGKDGIIRHDLLGRRLNFSSRAVISPDTKIKSNEVGVPIYIAKMLTISEKVTKWNIEKMKEYILNGPNKYPGANYVASPDGRKRIITEENKETLASLIEPGWIVERHLMDGDIVLFLRYPSLHRLSMMAHYVKVLPGNTFRISPTVVKPYNADFDGDEMNLFVPRSEESRAEAELLVEISNNFISPRHGNFVAGMTQEMITGLYLITQDDVKLSFGLASELVYISNAGEEDLKKLSRFIENAKKEGRDYLTGKEVASVFLPDDFTMQSDKIDIRNGLIVGGSLDSSLTKAEKGKLFVVLYNLYGKEYLASLLEKYSLLGIYYQYILGLTLAISDFDISEEGKKEIEENIKKTKESIDKLYNSFRNGTLERVRGKSLLETYELVSMQQIASSISSIQDILRRDMKKDTGTYIMSITGARGDWDNAVRMAGSLGFQAFRGKFVNFGYKGRNLSIFEKDKYHPLYYGWVISSYREGLKPWEMFFHALPGRDALMDTAIRTAQAGYFYRRLVLSLYDIHVNSDLSIKDSYGRIVQFLYGDDAIAVHKSISGTLDVKLLAQILKTSKENIGDGSTKKDKRRSRKK
ncbi:DNA-directed RNA polymerase subunit A' [Nanobdella aerobiophila]|uniref:DNA-directed RNA polymerase subunit Rpo1N n=1 Tax=Nanobdella aerobiophila TaxID=2586965 RepID=A0A915WRX3_9ARCH|nr:DNA-directed RNA polymerase subunit A' [Nanobdella aerobiophila]BBL45296.1 DNA-directed RNA polymerase subunit A' [Nanobdella aerobiophila]